MDGDNSDQTPAEQPPESSEPVVGPTPTQPDSGYPVTQTELFERQAGEAGKVEPEGRQTPEHQREQRES